MNNPTHPASKPPMLTRRATFRLAAAAAVFTAATVSGPARASQGPAPDPARLRLVAGHPTVAAVASAILGPLGAVEVSADVAATMVRIDGGNARSIAKRLLLKGEGEGRDRFLDDARNALRVAINLRELLSELRPELASQLSNNERAWARAFAKKAFLWGRRLQKSEVSGKQIRDGAGRVYLLEWAGATVDRAGGPPPAALGTLPSGPAAPTAAAYEAYIEALVTALEPR